MIRIQRFQFYELVSTLMLVVLFGFLVFTRPREYRPRSNMNCTSNMKQLGVAAALYEEDNAGTCPGPQPFGTTNALISWDRPLAIQMGASLKIDEPLATLTRTSPHHSHILATFTCPADQLATGARLVPLVPGSFADGTAAGTGICRSYSLNLGSGNLAGQQDGISANASAIPVSQMESVAGTIYLIDNHGYATVFGQRNIANDTTIVCTKAGVVMPADAFTNPAAPMHGTKSSPYLNALFYDGHVEVFVQATVTANGGEVMQIIKGNEFPMVPVKEAAK